MKFLPKDVDPNNIMLLDTIYHYPRKSNNYVDAIDIIYKELDTKQKKLLTIEEPEIEIYFTKPEFRNYEHNQLFFDLEKLKPHRCKYRNILFEIAKEAGGEYQNFAKQCFERRNMQLMKNLYKYPYSFGADYDIENWYRIQWLIEYDNDKPKTITKAFLDIETDGVFITGVPEDGVVPVNMCTIIDPTSSTVYTLLLNTCKDVEEYLEKYKNVTGEKAKKIPGLEFLREKYNPNMYDDFVKNKDNFIKKLHEDFDDVYGYFEYKIFMYEDERELLRDIFKLINTLKRDFLLIWNIVYDIPYLINRMKKLGMNPEEVICHPDFKYKKCEFRKDNINFKVANKTNAFKCSSYTKYLCQMQSYAAIRKGQQELPSVRLTEIAKAEIGDEKLDFSDVGNIKTLPYLDYELAVRYNIKDVFLQHGIELKTGDIMGIYFRSNSNAVEYDKVFKQLKFLDCRAYYEYYQQGAIIGNNINIDYGVEDENIVYEKDEDDEEEDDDIDETDKKKKEKFSGAIVADPVLNENVGILLFGLPSMFIFRSVIDMDFSSMYPHMIIAFNISPHTMIGKLLITKLPYEIEKNMTYRNLRKDKVENIKFDAGKDFVDNVLSDDILSLGEKWFNLPSVQEMAELVEKEFKIKNKTRINSYSEHLPLVIGDLFIDLKGE